MLPYQKCFLTNDRKYDNYVFQHAENKIFYIAQKYIPVSNVETNFTKSFKSLEQYIGSKQFNSDNKYLYELFNNIESMVKFTLNI